MTSQTTELRNASQKTTASNCRDCPHLVKGAIGVAKAITLPQTWASDAEIEKRRSICRSCEHATPCKKNGVTKCTCSVCKCILKLKTKVASESCPLEKWSSC